MDKNIRIAVADGHPMMIEGICNMLRPYQHISVMATYETGNSLLAGLVYCQPDVLLLDTQLPDSPENNLVLAISKKHSNIKMLVVASLDNPYRIKKIMSYGCLGYVLKSVSPEVLLHAIEHVNDGEKFVEPYLNQLLSNYPIYSLQGDSALTIRLTLKEEQILRMLHDGHNQEVISAKLALNRNTIENHCLALYQKLGVADTISLIEKTAQLIETLRKKPL